MNKLTFSTCFLVSLFFLTTAAAQEKSFTLEDFDIPENIGRVTERNIFKDSPYSIIYMQDAHGSYEAQKNISSILRIIKRKLKTDTVFVEGAEDILNTSWFGLFADKEVRKEVMDDFMLKGRLSGMEYFAIVEDTDAVLYGVEDTQLYLEDKKTFLEVQSLRINSEVYAREFQKRLKLLQEKVFNPDLAAFYTMYEKVDHNDITLLDYIKYVHNISEIHVIDLGEFSAYQNILKTEEYSKNIDFKSVQRERVTLIRALQKKMNKEDLKDFAVKSIRYRMRELSERKYNQYLLDQAAKYELDLSDKKEFTNYCDYIGLLDKINFDSLMLEVDDISDRIIDNLIKKPDEKELISLYHSLTIFEKMMKLELNRGDFYKFRNEPGKYFSEHLTNAYTHLAQKYDVYEPLPNMKVSFDKLAKTVMKFYELAIKRDTVMINKTETYMKDNNIATATLVTGGFHKEGIIETLRKSNISYIVISPTITEIPGHELYLSVMENKMTPVQEDIFEGFMSTKETK